MKSTGLFRQRILTGGGALLALVAACAITGCGGSGQSGRPDGDAGGAHDGAGGSNDGPRDTVVPDGACSDAHAQKANGQSCACASDCTSNFCVDGFCCNTACTETCKTCSVSAGTCTFIPAGTKPRDIKTCVAAAQTTCGTDGFCDGAGACRRYVAGTNCSAGTCDGDAVVGSKSCDGGGLCRPGPAVICAPYSCNPATGACFDTCAQSSQCVSGQQCVNSSCGKKMKGATCATNLDCASGFCADKVCCNVACQGGCVSCGLPGRTGTCWPIDPAVADPRGLCKDLGAPSCGTNGTCDGFGGCAKYAAETQCLAPTCTGIRRNTPGTCDGAGTCRPQGVQNCSPFRCVDGACNKTCLSDNDCEMGHACVKGLCGPKQNGQSCSLPSECLSTHCVDGVCCDTVCTGACRSCSLSSALGKCTSIAVGNVDSRGVCKDMTAASCSTNGKCDGSGGCQKYKMGTICAPETCTLNVYKPPSTCSSTGQCMPPDSLPCSPYVCNGTSCFNACTADANCLVPNVCNVNSCGKKGPGASCSAATECQSSFCAQGVCCDGACASACHACNLSGTLGACTSVTNGAPDPAGLCNDTGDTTCGTNGKCQAGVCQKYAKGTACKDSTCPPTTTTFTPDSTCDGNGACVTPAQSSCFPYRCGTNVCKGACAADGDCASPAVCINGSCGLKGLGKTCADGTECLSKFCAQGICCNSACNGTCQSCALPGSLGTCSSVANGIADPQSTCRDEGPASCGTDGVCDGRGACRLYAGGTQCVPPSCPVGGSTLTQGRTCDGIGNCQAASTIACAPFKCNGTAACHAACTSDADCLAPNICDPKTNLCGNKKRLGQPCGATGECLTGDFCTDAVCCEAPTCGLCQACNVSGTAGACADVGSGVGEPHDRCPANAPCGNTSNCNGNGACEQAGTGVSCGAVSCTGSTYTPISHCTGTGACATAMPSSCSPYVCGTGACKTVCVADGDCLAPYTCQGTGATKSCALKKNGLACTAGGQCISGNCVDGVCCGSSDCPACQACNLSGLGTCTPQAVGTTAPVSFCTDEGASSCGNTGKCNGAGGCQTYADGTVCSAASCPAASATLTMMGTCQGGTCTKPTLGCAPYFCNGVGACRGTCGGDADCAAGYYCTGVGGSCVVKKANGTACTAGTQCALGNCVDDVCCSTASCPSCQACNVGVGAGACSPMIAGTIDPNGTCTDQGATTCGTNGKCNGTGGCQQYANGTTCSQATCASPATLTLAGACSNGSCIKGTQPCSPFLCSAGACGGTCNTDGDCAGGTYCTGPGGTCLAKKSNGTACNPAMPTQCAFGNCVDGVCCDTACTGACVSCALTNTMGTCTEVGAGNPDPRGVCPDLLPASCSTNGKCNGAGGCQDYAPATVCSAALCPAGTATRTLPGTCATGTCSATTAPCGQFLCGASGNCLATCASNADCVPTSYCNTTNSMCVPKKAQGTTCNVGECATGLSCVENVCCGSASCPSCQSCAVAGSLGDCTPVIGGAFDPAGSCQDTGAIGCGTNGRCDGSGDCQFYGGATMCANATCSSASELTAARFCNGAGGCLMGGTVTNCGAYNCNSVAIACYDSCTDNGQCSGTNTCDTIQMSCGPP